MRVHDFRRGHDFFPETADMVKSTFLRLESVNRLRLLPDVPPNTTMQPSIRALRFHSMKVEAHADCG